MNDPSARVVRVDAPIASPGQCVICGKTEHPLGFADARLDFEFYGTLYLCADCVGDYARLFGYVSPEELVSLREHIEAQDLELNTLRQAVLGLESTVDGLIADAHRRSTQRADDIRRTRMLGTGDVLVLNPVDQPDAGPTDASTTGPDSTPEQPVQPADQQVTQQGRPDVSSTTVDELLNL